jgi:hypothetical protein
VIRATLTALALAASAGAQEPPLRGPRGIRDEFLLAQNRLSLPAVLPDTVAPGHSLLRLRFDWGNDFARNEIGEGEMPEDRRYLVDGEHRTLDVEWRGGLGRRVDAGLRVPLRWRGGGSLDGAIDWFHGFTTRLGLPDNDRPLYRHDAFRIEGRDTSGAAFHVEEAGSGLGNVELDARIGFGPRLALVPRLALPTGSGPFDADGVGLGLSLVGARRLGSWDVSGGMGATFESDAEADPLRYERWRAQGFGAVEWRTSRRFALLAETTIGSRLVSNVVRFPGIAWYLSLGARFDLDAGLSLEGGFTEGITDQQGVTDVGFQVALVRR